MPATRLPRIASHRSGFTLIELLVVVLIIGILAAIAVPQYFKVVEKGKSSEALATLDSLRSAQERYLSSSGRYCGSAGFCTASNGWDMAIPTLKYFTIGTPTATTANPPTWTVAMTRSGSIPSLYGAYAITYTVNGTGAPTLTCNQANCVTDLLPQ